MRRAMLVLGLAVLVPVLALKAQSPREHPHGKLDRDCGECHTAENWKIVGKPAGFRHESTGFKLEGAHAQASCRACHAALVFNHVGTACADCHKDAHRGELGSQCDACHLPASWTNQTQMLQVHNRTRLPLFATHARLDCTSCHRNQRPYQYATTPAECGNCHLSTYLATTSPNHSAAGFSRRCEDCHSVTAAAWSTSVFSHPATFPLSGAHTSLTCARCHGPGRPHAVSGECASCHDAAFAAAANPSHTAGGFPRTCQDCHTSASWRPATFDHSATRFQLTGMHTAVQCAACHVGGRYAGTATDCNSCHQADYARTTNPNHQAGRFSTKCQDCHSTGAWQPANFDHGKARFPLTGAHQRTACQRCHTGGRYTGTPTDCNSCHQDDYQRTTNPNHPAGGFSTACQTCHGTSAWRPAGLDHSKTRFPLTGAHARVACATCHTGGRYIGTPTACNSCHQADYQRTTNPNHQAAAFPTSCDTCHSTSAWRPASWDHDGRYFPIYSGKHRGRWSSCSDCHVSAGSYKVFECILCHEHSDRSAVDQDHRGVTGYAYQSAACYRCHSRGVAPDFRGGARPQP
jgi:cytochrome c7-like protein